MDARCGYVAIIGRPNSGKSTLFNCLVGQKISSMSYRPQTTRHRIVGVRTDSDSQFIFLDTPGIHLGGRRLLNRVLNKNALNVLHDVHLIFWLIDRGQWTQEEDHIKRSLEKIDCPVILVVNKIDKLERRDDLLVILQNLSLKFSFAEMIPISAIKQDNINDLVETGKRYLPESEFYYPEEYLTDRDQKFIVSETIREAAFMYLEKELPYATHIEIEKYENQNEYVNISAVIWIEKDGQKAILIGRKGEMLKKIGSRARSEIQKQIDSKVHLELWVKLKKDWQDNPQIVGEYES
ncbi:MAG: GTPase Era [Gammaproteobacteria bacterium]|nr:GTPase Era [Gammaproteobacteria bacterium]